MSFNKVYYLFSTVIFSLFVNAQIKKSFPIDTFDITGNFGEIRNRHFHTGIDFSTKSKENFPVRSIDEGYVYRIKISSDGYGKVLYILHPSGILSVYAHLNKFSDKIQTLVNRYQLQNNINEFDVTLNEDSLLVEKDEIIAFSGNTGSSTGPHLHFEIRNEITETPLNPFFYFDIKDTTKPVLEEIMFYDLSDTIAPSQISIRSKKSDTIFIPSITGLAFSGYDKTHPKANPNNIYKVQIFLDSLKIYQHRFNYITFDNTIYVEYFSEKINKKIFQKCFTPQLYPPFFYDTLLNRGRIILSDTNYHTLKLILCDEKDNCLEKIIYIAAKKINQYKRIDTQKLLLCTSPTYIKNKYFELYIPERALFSNLKTKPKYNIKKNKIEFSENALSLKYPATLKINHNLPTYDLKKTVLVCAGRYYIPEAHSNERIQFSIKQLGDMYLYTDKTPPLIKPLSYNVKKKAIVIPNSQNKIYFKVTDNTSIKDYKVYFNTQFCIAYYYTTTKLLVVDLPQELIASDENKIHVVVSDITKNTTEKVYKIIFK